MTKELDPAEASPEELSKWDADDADKLAASAHRIIECENVLDLFAKEIGKVIAGEEQNAKMLYLVATSRLFSKCMNAAIKGTSSGGKSEIRKRALEFFPPEDVISFTTLSEKALLYYPDDFAHKVLSMGEAAGAEELGLQDYLLRELISEGRLRYPVSQKEKGGGIATVIIEKNGPVAFMVTTTKNALHPENETRLISLEIDDSEKQTKAVLRKVAQVEGLNGSSDSVDYEPWRNFQRWLSAGNRAVVVPFADTLSDMIPAASVRLRRDFGQVLRAIKAHALLHREHRQTDDKGQIVADIEHDYAAVRKLMNALVSEGSGVSVRSTIRETMDAVAEVMAAIPTTDDKWASPQAVAAKLKLDKATAWRRLRAACTEGFIVNLETRPRQPGRYQLTGQKIVAAEPLMPAPEEVMQTAQTRKRGANGQVIETLNDCTTDCTIAPIAPDSPETVCAHCGEPGGEEWNYDGEKVTLHPDCADAYAADRATDPDDPFGLDNIPAGCERRPGRSAAA
jgi:hypothetical protein